MANDGRQLADQVRRAATEVGRVAHALERGLSEQPLVAACDAALGDAEVLRIGVLALDPALLEVVVAATLGREFSVLVAELPNYVGLVTLAQSPSGCFLRLADGALHSLESSGELVAALREYSTGAVDASAMHAVSVGLPAQQVRTPAVELCVIDQVERLNDRPTLRRIRETCDVVVVVGSPEATIDAALTGPWRELAGHGVPLTAVVVQPELAVDRAPQWVRALAQHATFPPVAVAGADQAAANDAMVGRLLTARPALSALRLARRTAWLAEAMSHQVGEEHRRVQARRANIDRHASSARSDTRQELRDQIEPVRRLIQDETQALVRAIEGRAKTSLRSGAALADLAESVADGVQERDLIFTRGHKHDRIALADDEVAKIRDEFASALAAACREDVTLCRDGMSAIVESANAEFEAGCGAVSSLRVSIPDAKAVWKAVRSTLSLETRYRGEFPRRGFFQRLMEGRRLVFSILMMLSIFGGAGMRSSRLMQLVMIVIFFVGFFLTYRSWKKEDRERMEKELDRARDAVRGEAKRLLSEARREMTTTLARSIQDMQKQLMRQLDDAGKRVGSDRDADAAARGRELDSQSRVLEDRQREFAGYGESLAAANRTLTDAVRGAARLLQPSARARGEG